MLQNNHPPFANLEELANNAGQETYISIDVDRLLATSGVHDIEPEIVHDGSQYHSAW